MTIARQIFNECLFYKRSYDSVMTFAHECAIEHWYKINKLSNPTERIYVFEDGSTLRFDDVVTLVSIGRGD